MDRCDRIADAIGRTLAKWAFPKVHYSPLQEHVVKIHLGEYERKRDAEKEKANAENKKHIDAIEAELKEQSQHDAH
jgi:hypothetical protein